MTYPFVGRVLASYTDPPDRVMRTLLLEPAAKVGSVGVVSLPVNELPVSVVRVGRRPVVRQGVHEWVPFRVSLWIGGSLGQTKCKAGQKSGRKQIADHDGGDNA